MFHVLQQSSVNTQELLIRIIGQFNSNKKTFTIILTIFWFIFLLNIFFASSEEKNGIVTLMSSSLEDAFFGGDIC